MVLPAYPKADRRQQCNVCKRSVPIQAMYIERRCFGKPRWYPKNPQPASDLYVVEGTHVSPVDKRRRCSLLNGPAPSSLSWPASSRHTRRSGKTAHRES